MRNIFRKLPYVIKNRFVLDVLQKQDINEAISFSSKIFCQQEPLLSFLKYPMGKYEEIVRELIHAHSNPMLSMTVKDMSSRVVGVCLAYEANMAGPKKGPSRIDDQRILALLKDAEEIYQRNYEEKKFTGRVLNLGNCAVDPAVRGYNLFMHMCYGFAVVGKQHGFSRLRSIDSSHFPCSAQMKMGFTKVGHIRYDDWVYKGPNGDETPFKGLNEFFTASINKTLQGKEPVVNAAVEFAVLDADINEVLQKSLKIIP